MKKQTIIGLIAIVAIATVALFSGCIEESVEEMKAKEDVEGLIGALDNWNSETRAEAAKALGEIGDESAINPLVRTLQDEDRLVREEAANALEILNWTPVDDTENAYYLIAKEQWNELVKLGELAVEPLIQALKYDDVRGSISDSLGKIGEPAIEPLIQALKSGDYDTKEAVCKSLEIIGKPAIEPLIESLKENRGWYDRSKGLEVLDKLGWEPRSLSTGTYIVEKSETGQGRLKVENGLNWDAIIVLSKLNNPEDVLVSVYIKSGDSYTITGIPYGTYELYYKLGKGWDDEIKNFSIIGERSRFEESFEFERTKDFWGNEYEPGWEVTLYEVSGGTAETEWVGEEDFPKLS